MDGLGHLKRLLGPLERRVRTLLMRGTLVGVDDSQDLQALQVTRLEGETFDGCERIGQYGLASVPPLGSEVVVGQIGSNADHQVILGVEDKSRPHPLEDGQICLYDKAGTKVFLKANGDLDITASGAVNVTANIVVLTAATVAVQGDMEISGNVVIGGTLNGHAP